LNRPRPVRLRDYAPPAYRVQGVELDFSLDAEVTLVRARLRLERRADHPDPALPLRLDGRDLELLEIRLDGRSLEPGRDVLLDGESLVLPGAGRTPLVETLVRLHPSRNKSLSGLYLSRGILCTQCEAEGFRRITYGLDRPDVRAPFRVRLEADRERFPVLLTNGNLVEEGSLPAGRHYRVYDDPIPKPSYLFALVAGTLKRRTRTIRTADGRTVTLELFAEPGRAERGDFALEALARALRFDEEVFGRLYDLDRYALVAIEDFNMGAMENKGLNIFNAKYVLATPETATDDDYEHVLAVVGHEYFHNWTGNRVGIRDWFHLALKEGLTTWREQLFTARHGGAPVVRRIRDVRFLRARQFPEDAGPLAHPVRPPSYIAIDNFYTVTVYEKGAELFRLAATLLGEETMRRALDLYFSRHDGEAVTLEDFRRALEEASGRRLASYQRWFDQAGTPHVRVRSRYDARHGRLDLTFTQHTPAPSVSRRSKAVAIPVRLGLLDRRGRALAFRDPVSGTIGKETTLVFETARTRFRLEEVSAPPLLSLFRGFSAPVVVERKLDDDDLALLAVHDPDGVNAWDALQEIVVRTLRRLGSGEARPLDPLVRVVRRVLARDDDGALVAEMLRLPEPAWLVERLRASDPARIERLRDRLRDELGRRLRSDWERLYERTRANGPYRPSREETARRALNNLALGYLAAGNHESGLLRARRHYERADNLTDRLGALHAVNDGESALREELLADFRARAEEEPALLDLWFSLEARSHGGDPLQRLRRLLSDPAYVRTNPNRVQALVGTFSTTNLAALHRGDGAGYRLLADELSALDALNPLVAARLAKAFGNPTRLPARNRAVLTAVLRDLRAGGVSRDLGEILDRLLAAGKTKKATGVNGKRKRLASKKRPASRRSGPSGTSQPKGSRKSS
jgi:aminopeptidase N